MLAGYDPLFPNDPHQKAFLIHIPDVLILE